MDCTVKKIITAFNKSAISYDEYAQIQNVISQKLCQLITCKENDKILDIGCGTGQTTHSLNVKPCNITQVDISYEMCVIAKRKNNINTVTADLHALPFKNIFDIAISSMAIHWSHNLLLAFRSILNIVHNSGHIYIAMPIEGTFYEIHQVFKQVNKRYNKFYTITEIHNILSQLGVNQFQILTEHYTEYYKNFRQFLRCIKNTGTYVTTNNANLGNKLFDISDTLTKIYENSIPISWKILYLVIKK